MEELFADHFWKIFAAVVLAVLGIVAVKINFDVNKWQEHRQEIRLNKAKALCPHAYFNQNENGISVESSYVSPRGTTVYVCSKCQHQEYNEQIILQEMQYWSNHPKNLIKREKKFGNALRKCGQ